MNEMISYREMTRSVFSAMNTRDFSEFEKILTENTVFDFPGAGCIEGRKKVLIFLKALLRKYPELIFTVKEIIIDNNRACAVWTNEGKHIEGHKYSNSGITLIHFSNENKIDFISDYFKDTSFVNFK